MKRVLCSLFAVLVLLGVASAYNGNISVYITRTGGCYHRDRCSYLKSRIEITLEDAVSKGYRPCSRCCPPHLGEGSDQDTLPYLRPSERLKEQKNSEAGVSAVVLIGLFILCSVGSTQKSKKTYKHKKEISSKTSKPKSSKQFEYQGLPAAEPQRMERLNPGPGISVVPEPSQKQKGKQRPTQMKKTESDSSTKRRRPSKRQTLKPDEIPLHPDFAIPYRERYTGKSISKEAGVPEGAWFDEEDFPHSKSLLGLDEFEVYISPGGKVYHTAGCPCSRNARAVNICAALAQKRRPCKQCNPMDTLPQWVIEYQRISKLRRQCLIDMLP